MPRTTNTLRNRLGEFVIQEMTRADIQAEYNRHKFTHGWEFAKTPIARLYTANTVIIGLNPGGSSTDSHWDCEQGNDFFLGSYGDRWRVIQTQVKILHEILQIDQDQAFIAQFNPFRSVDYKSIENPEISTDFANKLWDWVLLHSPARRFICMGSEVTWHISRKLNAKRDDGQYKTGWGEKLEIQRYVSSDGRVVVNWPHPSRYTIFTRNEPEKAELAKSSMIAAARLN
jgi:hypothetical protein